MGKRSIDTLVLDEEVKTRSLEDVREFLSEESKQWYKDNSLPYHRGYLFVRAFASVSRSRMTAVPDSTACLGRGRRHSFIVSPMNLTAMYAS